MHALRRILGRRWRMAGLLALVVAGLAALPVLANLDGSGFDADDGNLVVNDEAKDWANAPNFTKTLDKLQGQGDDSFGQGTSEDTAVPTVKQDSIPPNKSDITRFYKAHETVDGKTFLYLAWERITEPSGTTNFDFELNQSKVISSNGVTPVRTAGDVLVKYDLAQGGTNPVLGFHRWVESSTQSASAVCEANNKFPCWEKVTPMADGVNFEASINESSVTDPIAPGAPRELSPRTFGEAAINLTDAGILPADDCTGFASAYLKSRSSDSFNAALKDFAAPLPANINNCQPATIKLKKVDEQGDPLAGATMQLFKDENANGTLDPDTDSQVGDDCTTGADGICSFELQGASTSDGTYIGHEKAAPPGYLCCAADQTQVVTIGSALQTFTLTFADELAPGKIEITKTDDAGNALKDAVFTLYQDNAPVGGTRGTEDGSTDKTCTTDSAGKCTISDVAPGDYWVVETTTPAGHDTAAEQSVTVPKGSQPNQGATVPLAFENPRQHRVIVLVCHEGSDTLAASDVTLDGNTKRSLSKGSLTATQEKALCDTGGATFGGISGHPAKSPSIDVGGAAHP